jgi:biopolymer transport protein TolR
MASVTLSRGRRKRFVSDINVVPYIDVMLVLLVIFMVTAPLIPTGVVNLPTVGQAGPQSDREPYVEIEVDAQGNLRLRTHNTAQPQERAVPRAQLAATLRELRPSAAVPVVIAGDGKARYEQVLDVLDEVQGQGVGRVGLLVRTRQ